MFETFLHLTAPLASMRNQLALVAAVYGVISALSPLLQIARMQRVGSSESISHSYVLISVCGYLVWFAYGIAMRNVPLIVCDAIGLLMQLAVLGVVLRLRRPDACSAATA